MTSHLLACLISQNNHPTTHTYVHRYTHTYVHTDTHTYAHTHMHAHIHTHTCTHTHTHTRAYSTGKRRKASTNMHSKQARTPLHKICRFLCILKAKKLFVLASSSKLWVHHLCARFQSSFVHAKAFPCCRHLPNLSVCDSWHSPTSASLLSLFRGNGVKAFEMAAIEDDAGTKTASNGTLTDRILSKWLARW